MIEIDKIENIDYGYGDLEDKIICLFRSGAPDFETANKLIELGADLNAEGKYDDENILSEIIAGYWWTETGGGYCEQECSKEDCRGCRFNKNPDCGAALLSVIRFFLNNGFDVTKNNHSYGAQCLHALVVSVFDKHIIDAAKIFFDAGAKNVSSSENEEDFPLDFAEMERGYQYVCCHDHHLGNIYHAVCQVYYAIENEQPYQGIDSYEAAFGKIIRKVLAEKNGSEEVFYNIDYPNSKHDNCFSGTLYFVFDGGVLIITQYVNLWVDSVIPNIEISDVSDRFSDIIGTSIKNITFEHNEVLDGTTEYGQPVAILHMGNGKKLTVTNNFSEVKDDTQCVAYFIKN